MESLSHQAMPHGREYMERGIPHSSYAAMYQKHNTKICIFISGVKPFPSKAYDMPKSQCNVCTLHHVYKAQRKEPGTQAQEERVACGSNEQNGHEKLAHALHQVNCGLL